MSSVIIVDYGTGNLNSIKRTLDRVSVDSKISSLAEEIRAADKIILPGVGHFGNAMSALNELGLIDALNDAVLEKRTPILGICLGMELMAKRGDEGNVAGLSWLDAEAVRFDIEEKVPHMGWNQIAVKKDSPLMNGIAEDSEFYFAHSYHLSLNDPADALTETLYGIAFPSAIAKDNIFGVQFHPEKSHDAGARLLKNFADM
ncbi:MAG: imidazole glycerol phosphate synthase subunit HisH [Acidobacteria bacterium]|nr:MAG: imidazole glycerol phosphate synthase subunit HisH [Acidobacteriota bacterium]